MKAVLVTEITVIDPDSKAPVEVSTYKDKLSGGVFGIDSSYIASHDEDEVINVPSPFNEGLITLP